MERSNTVKEEEREIKDKLVAKSQNGKIKNTGTTWTINATYSDPKTEDSNSTESKERPSVKWPAQNITKEFRPSPHLGDFYDFESAEIPSKQFGRQFPVTKKPATGFKLPKDYKISTEPGIQDGWKVARPITVHAGDIYKQPNAFKDIQDSEEIKNDEEGFGLSFKEDFPDHGMKKK